MYERVYEYMSACMGYSSWWCLAPYCSIINVLICFYDVVSSFSAFNDHPQDCSFFDGTHLSLDTHCMAPNVVHSALFCLASVLPCHMKTAYFNNLQKRLRSIEFMYHLFKKPDLVAKPHRCQSMHSKWLLCVWKLSDEHLSNVINSSSSTQLTEFVQLRIVTTERQEGATLLIGSLLLGVSHYRVGFNSTLNFICFCVLTSTPGGFCFA